MAFFWQFSQRKLIKAATLFYRQSIGVFTAIYLVLVMLAIGPSTIYELVLPLVVLKGLQYPGLIYYYKLLRPDKLIFFMNLGQPITLLWVCCLSLDFLVSVMILQLS